MKTHHPQWKSKVQELIQTCQDELKKTTEIGKKMLNASKTNSSLHENYEKLGMLVEKELENKNLTWENPQVSDLLEQISTCKKELEDIEVEVNKIKFASAPEDISKNEPASSNKNEKSQSSNETNQTHKKEE